MAHDSVGTKNQPQYAGTGAPADAADLSEISNYAAKLGNRNQGTSATRVALTGADLWAGLEFYETDTGLTYLYQGSWLIWASDWVSFTTVWSGAGYVAGDSSTTFVWRYIGGEVEFILRRVAGTTGVLSTSTNFSLPVNVAASVTGSEVLSDLGSVVISSTVYLLAVLPASSSSAYIVTPNAAGTYAKYDRVTNSIPAALVTGTEVYVAKGRYPIR